MTVVGQIPLSTAQPSSASLTAGNPSGASPDDSLEGRVFGGRYRIIGRLGHGGMGAVYRAEHTLLERTVALKVLHSFLAENAEYLERFKREALVASRLSHPNAITLYDFGIEEKAPYFVMQYVEGATLKEILLTDGPLSLERTNAILQQVGGALREAHKLGIVHRDLKPDNIMVSKDHDGGEKALILDFGIAKPLSGLGDATAANLTQSGMFMGTPQYMSPEQAIDRPCDQRADIYALGIIVYEMITGEVPFKSHSPVEMLFKHLHEVPTPPREFKPELNLPEAVSVAVQKALAKSPDDRFQRVEEFVAAFAAAIHTTAHAAGKPHQPSIPEKTNNDQEAASVFSSAALSSAPETLAPARAGGKKPLVIGLGLGAAALLGGAFFALRSEDSSVPALPTTSELASIPTSIPTPSTTLPLPAPTAVSENPAPPATLEPVPSPSPVAPPETVAPPADSPTLGVTPPPVEPPPPAAEPAPPADPFSLFTVESITQMALPKGSAAESDAAYQEGQKLSNAKEYQQAAELFKNSLLQRPTNTRAWLSLGVCMIRLGKPELALLHFREAERLQPNYPPTQYNIASYYAVTNDAPRAVQELKKAIAMFPKMKSWLATDPDFDNIRSDPEFQKLQN